MKRLKELRVKYGLTLRELQKYTGIDFSRLAVIEKSDVNVELKTIEKLCNFFKVSATYLLGKDGFIFYFDELNKRYFSMPFEQYKRILNDDVVSFSIVDGSIRRIISVDGYERIKNADELAKNDLERLLITSRFINFLDSLDDFDFNRQKDILSEYFESREARGFLEKRNFK